MGGLIARRRAREAAGAAVLWAALALVLAACSGSDPPPAPATDPDDAAAAATERAVEDDVREAFAAYRASVAVGAGEAVQDLVTPGSFAAFEEIGELARSATAEEVRALPATPQLLVLTLRTQATPAELEELRDGSDVLAYLVAGRYAGQDRSLGGLGEIDLAAEDVAVGVVEGEAGADTPLRWRFERVDGQWRFDLVTAHRLNDQAIATAARRTGTTVEALVRTTLERLLGEPLPEDAYEPPAAVGPPG